MQGLPQATSGKNVQKIQSNKRRGSNKSRNQQKIEKIDKNKTWFFEKINKINNHLARIIRIKDKTQINNIKNEKVNTPDSTGIEVIIRESY